MLIEIHGWLKKPELWSFLGFASAVVGLLCYALSSSFHYLFREWNLLKILIYSVFSLIICLLILFVKLWKDNRGIQRKAHMVFIVLTITSLYSFFFDRAAANGKPDAYSIVSCTAFAIMSLSLSRQIHWEFEVDLLHFFLSGLTVQLMKINLLLALVGVGFSYAIIILRSSLDDAPETGNLELHDQRHLVIHVDSQQSNAGMQQEGNTHNQVLMPHVDGESETTSRREEDEVDAKADDFFEYGLKTLILRTGSALKHSWDGNMKRFGFCSKGSGKPVQWFIGDSTTGVERERERERERRGGRESVEFYSNGDFYEGEFHGGKSNGSGVYHYFVSGRYEGDWVDGRYDGYGIESWARGSRYKGQYREGSRHGYGVYRFYTGDSYAGEWCNGQSHGVGVQNCSDGSCYVGEFKYGVKHGLGCYHFRNGDRHAGEYFGDKIHGFGVYHFANGHCYEGAWHEGRKQGYGVYTFRNCDRKCGEWDAGNLKHSLPPQSDAILRAVQAARKAAENAANLDRKDDQVNKAIIAANRAATAARVAATAARVAAVKVGMASVWDGDGGGSGESRTPIMPPSPIPTTG